jgi:hypothetical protein
MSRRTPALAQFLAPVLLSCPTAAALHAAQQRTTEPRPDPAADLPCVDAPADGRELRVVDAATGKPVSGAFVTWFPSDDFDPDGRDHLAPEPALKVMRAQFGKTVRSGADGTARVAKEGRLVVASAGDRYGGGMSWRSSRPIVIELKPRRSIVVVAHDRDGKALADVPIGLRAREESGGPANEWHAHTGADGRVEIGPLDLYAAFESEAQEQMHVAVEAPLGAPLVSRFTLAEMPTKPVEFTLPPTGRLVVDAVDADGKPFAERSFASVRKRWDFAKDEPAVDGAHWPAVDWHAYDLRSHHELPYVELGLRLVVDASPPMHGRSMKQIVDGPKQPGETVTVRLVAPAPDLVRGRILDEKGEPVARREVRVFWSLGSSRYGRRLLATGTTDEAGRVAASIDRHSSVRFDHEFEPWLEAIVPRADGNGIERSGQLALAKTKEIGALDFGEIHVRRSPPLVSGVVVDDAGAPVAGADLVVTVLPKERRGGLSGNFTDRQLRGTTDASGHFTVWGDAPVGDLSIRTEAGEVERAVPLLYGSSAEFDGGASDVRLTLERGGTVILRVVGEPKDVEGLGYTASSKRGEQSRGGQSGGIGRDGVLEIVLPAGVATVQLERGGTVVATREGIEVKPGETTEVAPIELAAVANVVELTIVDELGKPVSEGWIVTTNAEDDERVAQMKKMFGDQGLGGFALPRMPSVDVFKDGKYTLRSDQPLKLFAVGAKGRTAVVVRHAAKAERVVLEPARRVEVVLEYDGESVAPPLAFVLTLAPPNDDEEWVRFGPGIMSRADALDLPRLESIVLDRGKPTALPIRCLGRVQLDLVLGEKRPGFSGGTTIDCEPKVIDVGRTSERQLFKVKVDRAAIDAILEERKNGPKPKSGDE